MGALLIAVSQGRPVLADIAECAPGDPTVYNIFVDEVRPFDNSAPSNAEKQVRDALNMALSSSLVTLAASTGEQLRQNLCPGRYPMTSDFAKRGILDPLDNGRVVLELWGTMQQSGSHIQASFNLVVIPAQLHYVAMHEPPRGLLEIRRDVDIGSAHRLSPLLERNDEIKAYALIGAGLKALDLKDYLAANSYLCSGEQILTSLSKTHPDPEAQTLLAYVHDLGNKVFQDAQSGSAANTPLKLLGTDKQALRCRLQGPQ